MPNLEVKPDRADGTVWGTYGRVGLCQKTIEEKQGEERNLFTLLFYTCVSETAFSILTLGLLF